MRTDLHNATWQRNKNDPTVDESSLFFATTAQGFVPISDHQICINHQHPEIGVGVNGKQGYFGACWALPVCGTQIDKKN